MTWFRMSSFGLQYVKPEGHSSSAMLTDTTEDWKAHYMGYDDNLRKEKPSDERKIKRLSLKITRQYRLDSAYSKCETYIFIALTYASAELIWAYD